MSASELYTKGARVWTPDTDLVWKGAQLLEDYVGQKVLRVQYEDEAEEGTINVSEKTLPNLRNPEILIGENDLTSLSYLNEPEVLYNLKVRFAEQNMIYTYCGIVLVAINPYEYLDIYSNDIIQAYSGQDMGTMDPHIFAVSDEAFKQMSRFDRNQSIIVSGESGAGKTVSAKFAMRYFASVGGSQAETQVERKVLASNPIMEAIGNAKTTRNDNSSRFGKYIEISFSKRHSIVGAHMRTYLLEKSRVVFQASEERNYHVFYQLCASASLPEFKEFHLRTADDFFYTSQGAAPEIQNVNDAEEMVRTREAFKTLGFSERDQMMMFQIFSAVLHFGNVSIKGKRGETCEIPVEDPSITIMCKLLGIEESQMRMWLCHRKIQTVNETLIKPLTESQASFARDALVKTIYSRLFDWIVAKINKSLLTSAKSHTFIGVLDIYGFETFETNSFEQFCINYANEKLQQIFNMHVFKLEQEEYVREEIAWSFIDFYDNQPCIDLIESKLGILDLLDDECKMPKGSDINWCQKLYDKHLNKSHHFGKPRLSRSAFIINHFADKVQYQSDGFLEKNRDTVMEEQINTLKASEYELVGALFVDDSDGAAKAARTVANPPPRAGSKQNRRTVGSQFRDSLCALMETLNATTPHYIRCIKPNDVKEAFLFDPKRAVEQLRACGVLETIRISAAGYPSRWTYPEFFQRYRVLAQSNQILKNDIRKTCELVLAVLIPDEDKYRFGKTKIFFRAGQVAYLEKLRTTKLQACGVMIQKHIRGWLQRCKYQRVRRSVLLVQTFARGLLARRFATFLRKTKAATLIQAVWRGYHQRNIYSSTCSAIVVLQAHVRALFARKQYLDLRQHCRALVLQKSIRAFVQRQKFRCIMAGIILVQSHFRRRKARAQLKALKAEAKSVDHIKQVNKGLENKVIELQQKLNEKIKQAQLAKVVEGEMSRLKEDIVRLKNTEEVAKFSANKIADLEEEVARLRKDMEKIQGEKRDWGSEKEEMRLRHEKMVDSITQEKTTLREELDVAIATIKGLEDKIEGFVREKETTAKNMFVQEFESERAHHQKLVGEHTRLQQKLKNLQDEMQVLRRKNKGHRHSESDTSVFSVDSYNMADVDHKQEEKSDVELDIGLMLRLQNRVRDLEKEKNEMKKKLDGSDENVLQSSFDPDSAFYALRMQELQNENDKQKKDIARLMKSISETANFSGSSKKSKSSANVEFLAQFEAMMEELERRRAECLQLKTMLADKSISVPSIAKESYGGVDKLGNKDNELELAYTTQKDLNRLLQAQLDKTEKQLRDKEKQWADETDELRKENDRLLQVFRQGLNLSPEARIELTVQHEIERLMAENLDLRDSLNKQAERIDKLDKMLKIYARKLKGGEATAAEIAKELDKEDGGSSVASVIHRERGGKGMLEYKKEDVPILVRNLILDLKPQLAITFTPGLPAYILFMCVLHTDYINNDEKIQILFTSTIGGIRKAVKSHSDDLDCITLWLANTCRLLHTLKQYSGEKQYQAENSPKQNEQCLRNFDLSEYRQVFSDLAVWAYQLLIKKMEEQIQPYIVPAILEHEGIAGLTASKPSGLRGRSSSIVNELDDGKSSKKSLNLLEEMLHNYMQIFKHHQVDQELVRQIFRQLFYFMCAHTLNNLLLRKDMCNWSKGMQIRYNLNHLEQWLRDNSLQESGAAEKMEPIIEASQLLQARKTESDVDSICEMCSQLTNAQIVKILTIYTPVDEFEERVPAAFIRKIQAKLKQREPQKTAHSTLLMDTKFSYSVTFPFNPSSVALETLSVPEKLQLDFLIQH